MDIFQQIRNKVFWAKDFFYNNEIRNNIQDIKNILEDYHSEHSKSRREQLLADILRHATHHTPYYQQFKGSTRLSDFPVINKGTISRDHTNFLSFDFREQDCYKILTSGSTGTPFKAFQDRDKKIRNTADTIYFAKKANFKIGQKLIYMRRWSTDVRRSRLRAIMQNLSMVNVTELNEAYFEKWLRELRTDRSEKCLMGYVSGFTQLCKYLDKIKSPPLDCGLTSIIAVAESLSDYCRISMEKYFGVPVISRYSNMENGILAQECPGERHFNINWASYVIEILHQEKDDPVEYGKEGRIVITDLFNHIMPMIRYDTGDLGIMALNDQGIPVLKNVLGRSMDMIYNTRGEMINPAVVRELKYYHEIKQFQMIQQDRCSYTIRLTVDGPFNRHDELIRKYKGHFGEDAQISIEETDEIPVLASGKRKLVVNNYSKLN